MRIVTNVWLGLALLSFGCGGDQREAGESESAQQGGMGGMAMRMPSTDMLPAVRAYLDSVVAAEPTELTAMVAGHPARMEQMLSAMDQDMKAMNMMTDATWQALTDSARADLTSLPGLRGEPLILRMRAHAGRMRRLLERHESMMKM